MNRGEGLRIAAQAKSGKIGVYFQEPKKKKKFNYKGRTQQFAVRKPDAGNNENQQVSQAATSKQAASKALSSKTFSDNSSGSSTTYKSKNPKILTQKTKSRTDEINKHKQAQKKQENSANKSDVVTLTQDQLNAILQTIGSSGSGTGSATIAIDGGKLTVKQNSSQEEQTISEPQTNDNTSSVIANGHAESDHHGDDYNNNTFHSSHQNSSSNGQELWSNKGQKSPKDKSVNEGQGTMDGQKGLYARSGGQSIDLSSSLGGIGQYDNRSLVEKKRQQWKAELDAQLAEKKALQERASHTTTADTWSPWGQPGGGAAPITTQGFEGSSIRQQMGPAKSNAGPGKGQGSSDVLGQSMSGAGFSQQKVPAAMRTSMVFGGPLGAETDSHLVDVKRKEKEEWLRELEKQRLEAKEKKEREKARFKEATVIQHWADPVEPTARRTPRIESTVSKVQDDIGVQNRMAAEQVEKQPKSAPPPSNRVQQESNDENIMHIRPANTLIDPAEMERREQKRKKHLEHMEAVKAQVAEKQRLKREAEERRRREEAEEERRLREERDRLAQDFEMEREKAHKKEEAAAAKQRALAESMHNAQREAALAKQQQRMSRLQGHGHDVTNLRKSWDANMNEGQTMAGTSPRLATQAVVTKQPHVATSLNFSPRRGDQVPDTIPSKTAQHHSSLVPHAIRDAATSPIHEVATQTEIDVLATDYISPRLLEAIRLASAGAEFKPKDKQRKDTERKKQSDEKTDYKSSKASSRKEEADSKKGANRRENNAEKPKWGQAVGTKKKLKNSEKDMTMSKKKREERLKKRQEELLALQEKSAPKRLVQSTGARSDNSSEPEGGRGSKARAESRVTNQGATSMGKQRAGAESRLVPDAQNRLRLDKGQGGRKHSQASQDERSLKPGSRLSGQEGSSGYSGHGPASSEDSYSFQTSSDSPPLQNNDFVPFMRTEDEELQAGTNQSLSPPPPPAAVSDELRQVHERDESRELTDGRYRSQQAQREMDPLLNPDRLKDKEHRQEQILFQLSNLRQNLLMKQREMEMGFSPTPSAPVTIQGGL